MTTVEEALELLLDVVHREMIDAQETVTQTLREQQFEAAQAALDRAREFKALEAQILAVERELARLIPPSDETAGDAASRMPDDKLQKASSLAVAPSPRRYQRARRGLKTPESAYMRPILQTLVEMGGSGDSTGVLERVYIKMKGQLNDHDHTRLPSNRAYRWRNTAEWARYTLREQGYLRSDSPRGIWAISEAGRAWLAMSDGERMKGMVRQAK